MELPSHNSTYKRQEYWEERFSKEETYEWLSGYSSVRTLLRSLIKPTDKILHLGCGNSDLSREMYQDGFHHITNIDFSPVCIAAQKARNEVDCPEMSWLVMDMLRLDFPAGSFDVVVDKCTLDALVVDEGDVWDPRTEVREQVDEVLTGVSRILKPNGGLYLQMSFGQPIHRLNNYFEKEKYQWNVSVQNWGDALGFGYFFYTFRRTNDAAELQQLSEYHRAKERRLQEDEERVRALAEQQRAAHESDDEHDEERMLAMDL